MSNICHIIRAAGINLIPKIERITTISMPITLRKLTIKISLKNNLTINDSTLIMLRLINGNEHAFKALIKGHNKCW